MVKGSFYVLMFIALVSISWGFRWDPRLYEMRVSLERATPTVGQPYWELVEAVFLDDDQSGGRHHIEYYCYDESGRPVSKQKVWQAWSNGSTSATTDSNGYTNIPNWACYDPNNAPGGYDAYVDGISDKVRGMGLPWCHHVVFILTFRRTVYTGATPTPEPLGQLGNGSFESGMPHPWFYTGTRAGCVNSGTNDVTAYQGNRMWGWSATQETGEVRVVTYQPVRVTKGDVCNVSAWFCGKQTGGYGENQTARVIIDPEGDADFVDSNAGFWVNGVGSKWKEMFPPKTASNNYITVAIEMRKANVYWDFYANYLDNVTFRVSTNLTASPTPPPTPTPVCTNGDADCNGEITPADALIAFQIYLSAYQPGGEPCDVMCAADYNDDSEVTPADALCVFRAYLGNPC